jgi:hypothetical protein
MMLRLPGKARGRNFLGVGAPGIQVKRQQITDLPFGNVIAFASSKPRTPASVPK